MSTIQPIFSKWLAGTGYLDKNPEKCTIDMIDIVDGKPVRCGESYDVTGAIFNEYGTRAVPGSIDLHEYLTIKTGIELAQKSTMPKDIRDEILMTGR